MATVAQMFQSLGLWQWFNSPVTNQYNGVSEKGEDFSTTWGTSVGAAAPGTVVSVVHNNNSIGDVVEINGPSGLWLYQHINSSVAVGDQIDVGTIVGTENGLPVDQYSTGPHIEVRWASQYIPGIDSWNEPWSNPNALFSGIGAQDAGNVTAVQYASNPNFSYSSGGATAAPTPEHTFINVGLFSVALVLVLGGLYMLFNKQIDGAFKAIGHGAEKAVVP